MNFKYSLISFSNWMIDSYCPLPESEPPVLPESVPPPVLPEAPPVLPESPPVLPESPPVLPELPLLLPESVPPPVLPESPPVPPVVSPLVPVELPEEFPPVVLLESDLSFEFFVLFVVVDLLACPEHVSVGTVSGSNHSVCDGQPEPASLPEILNERTWHREVFVG